MGIYISTSGWSYDWENFYPDDLAKKDRLKFYSEKFNTVEVNYSFYRLPRRSTCEKWENEVKSDFCFAIKMSRYITHIKRLKGVKTVLRQFLGRI